MEAVSIGPVYGRMEDSILAHHYRALYRRCAVYKIVHNYAVCRTICIAGKFGRKYIWPPTTEIKYWQNLNLAICDCEAIFHYVILACGYGRSAEVNLAVPLAIVKLNYLPNFPPIG